MNFFFFGISRMSMINISKWWDCGKFFFITHFPSFMVGKFSIIPMHNNYDKHYF